MTMEELMKLAERCISIVSGFDEDLEDCAQDALTAGEPASAIADALDIAYSHPELYAKFPDEVYELAKNPDSSGMHAFLPQLEASRK